MTTPPYAFGQDSWPGLGKLVEENGELAQVLGKLIAYPNTDEDHPDGTNLRPKLIEELGDMLAAIATFSELNLTEDELTAILDRADLKVERFTVWHEAGIA